MNNALKSNPFHLKVLVIPPMQFLHDGFAAHHTEKTLADHPQNETIAEDGTHCVCHSIEAISPFLSDIDAPPVAFHSNYVTVNDYTVSLKKNQSVYTVFRRGPPSSSFA